MTRDKLASLIKKWQTLVEGNVDVKTTDGHTLRMFAIGFTTKMPNQVSKMCYANSAQVRQIRKKMVEVRPEGSRVEIDSRVHGRRDRKSLCRDLPDAERVCPQGQGPQEAEVRPGQAHGAALRRRRRGFRRQGRGRRRGGRRGGEGHHAGGVGRAALKGW